MEWSGWNGGKRPVHHRTLVKYMNCKGEKDVREAGLLNWNTSEGDDSIVAYKVLKECKEPRDFWIIEGFSEVYFDFYTAQHYAILKQSPLIHLREIQYGMDIDSINASRFEGIFK